MKRLIFLYAGDISPLFRGRTMNERVYNDHTHMNICMQNVFESQLLGTGKFKGNVRVDALVYMPFPEGMGEKRQKEKDNHYYRNNPSVAGMMRALEGVCGDLLFEKDTVIVAMSMEKRWSVDPRLEMIISEVGLYEREEDKKEKKGSD